jgi:hypothetical protein
VTAELLQAPRGCDRCLADPRADQLFTPPIGGRVLCAKCWHEMGEPFPAPGSSAQALHEAELATRARMQARGGTDRHLVRNGRS